jgi:hypothetical protein
MLGPKDKDKHTEETEEKSSESSKMLKAAVDENSGRI